jgi:hypothetical protein
MIPVCSPSEKLHQPMIWTTHTVALAAPRRAGVALKLLFMVIITEGAYRFNFS